MLHIDVHGRGARVVLAHGFTQTGRSWAPLLPALAARHQVVAVDLPGHGRSSGFEVDLWEGGRLLGEVGGRATYLGYSMGGRLCLHLALAAPYLVRGLVLVGATPGIEAPGERAARRRSDEELAVSLERDGLEAFLERWLARSLFAGLSPGARQLEVRRENTAAALAASLRLAGTGAQEPLWDRLSQLTVPVLVVAGEHDEKFTAIGRRMVDAIGPSARFALVPGAGHAAHLERPAAFLDAVRPALDRADDEPPHDSASPSASSAP